MERDDPARGAGMEIYSGSKIKGLARWRERGDNKEKSLEEADISISGSHCCSSKLWREASFTSGIMECSNVFSVKSKPGALGEAPAAESELQRPLLAFVRIVERG